MGPHLRQGTVGAAAPGETHLRNTLLAAVLLVAMATASAADATTYYLSTAGNNANAGTSTTTPWRTLDRIYLKAYSSYPFLPGDNILLRAGDVFDGQVRLKAKGTATAPITLGAYGGGPAPVVRGDRPSILWHAVTGWPGIYYADLGEGTVTGAVYDGTTKLKATSVGATSLGNLSLGSWGPATASNRIWVRTLAGGAPTAVRTFGAGIYVEAGSSYTTVLGIDVDRCWTGVDVSQSASILVSHCRVTDALSIGVYLRSGDVSCSVEDCATERTAGDGLYVLGGLNCRFRDNTVTDVQANVLGLPAGADHCGIGLQQSTGTLVESNVIRYVLQLGIDYYYDVGSVVRGNVVLGTPKGIYPHSSSGVASGNLILLPSGAGVGLSAFSTGGAVTVRDNIIWGAGAVGILADASSGPVSVRQNTIYSTTSTCRALIPTGPVSSVGNLVRVIGQ